MKISIETSLSSIDDEFVNENSHLTQLDNDGVYLYNSKQIVEISNSQSFLFTPQSSNSKKAYTTNGSIGLLNNRAIRHISKESTKFIVSLPCKIKNIIQVSRGIVLVPEIDIQYIFKLDNCHDVPEPIYFDTKRIMKEISQDTGITFNSKSEKPTFNELYSTTPRDSFNVMFKGISEENKCNILINIAIGKISSANNSFSGTYKKHNNSTLKDSFNLSYTDIIKPKDLPETSIGDLEISYNGMLTMGVCFVFKERDVSNFDFLICNSSQTKSNNIKSNKLIIDSFDEFKYFVYVKELNHLLEYKFESMKTSENKTYIFLQKTKVTQCFGIFPLKQNKCKYNDVTIILTELFCIMNEMKSAENRFLTLNIYFDTLLLKQQNIETNKDNFIIKRSIDFSVTEGMFVVLLETETGHLKTLKVKLNFNNESLLDEVLMIYKSIYGHNDYYELININNKEELIKRIKYNISEPKQKIKFIQRNTLTLNIEKQEMFYQYCYMLLILNKVVPSITKSVDNKYVIELINSVYTNYNINNISPLTMKNFFSVVEIERLQQFKEFFIQRHLLNVKSNKQLHISKKDVQLYLFGYKKDLSTIDPNIIHPSVFLEIYGTVLTSSPYSIRTNPHMDAICNLYSVDSIQNLIINQPLKININNEFNGHNKENSNLLTLRKEGNNNTLDSDQKYICDSDISHISTLNKKVLRTYSVQFPVVFKSKGNLNQTMGKHEASKKVKGLLIQYLLKRCFIVYGKLALVVSNMDQNKDTKNKPDHFKRLCLEGLIVPENIELNFQEDEILDISTNLNVKAMLDVTKFLNELSFYLNVTDKSKKKDFNASDILAKALTNKVTDFQLDRDLSEFWRSNALLQNATLLGFALSFTNTSGNFSQACKTTAENFIVSEIAQFRSEQNHEIEIGNNCIALVSLGLMNFKKIDKKYIAQVKTYFIQKVVNNKENSCSETDPLISYFITIFIAAVSFGQYNSVEKLTHTRSVLKYVSNYRQFNNRDINIANSLITGCLFFGSENKNISKSFYKNNNLRFQEEDPKVVYFSSLCYYLIMHSKLNNLNDVKKFLSSSNPTLLDVNDLQHYAAKILVTGIVNRNKNLTQLKHDLLHIYNEYSNIYLDGSDFNNFSGSYVETFFSVVMLAYTLINTDETNEGIFDDIKNDVLLISTENTMGIYYYSIAGALEASKVKFSDSDFSTFCLLLSFIDHFQMKNLTENINGLLRILFLKAIKTEDEELHGPQFHDHESVYTLKHFDDYLAKIKTGKYEGMKNELLNGLKKKVIFDKWFVSNPYNLGLIKLMDLEENENKTKKVNNDVDEIKRKIIVDKIFEMCKERNFVKMCFEDRCIFIFDCLQKKMDSEYYFYHRLVHITLQEVMKVYNEDFNANK